jgi:hypothetical protein
MRVALLFCLLFISASGLFAQDRISLKPGFTTNLKPHYSKTSVSFIDTVHLQVVLTGAFDTTNPENNTMHLEIARFNLPNKPRIADSAHITFPANAWPVDGNKKDTTIIISLITESFSDSLKNDEAGHLFIKDHPAAFHTLRLTNTALGINTKFDPNKSFWMEVGSNFDLIDGPKPNNFFAGVFLYKRDIRPIFYKGKNKDHAAKNLAIFAGVYESKSVTSETQQSFSSLQYYDSSSLQTNKADTMKVFNAVGNYVSRRTVRNVGLFISPQVRLTNGDANHDGLHLFASFWMELQWQKIEEEVEFSQLKKMDSSYMPIRYVLDSSNIGASGSIKKETDLRSHYFGFGLPIFLRETVDNDIVHLFVNPVIGVSNQPSSQFQIQQPATELKQIMGPRRKWSPFYLIQFRLNEETYGLSFTGEVRGLLKTNNKPTVSLALSKKFNLSRFMEFNK